MGRELQRRIESYPLPVVEVVSLMSWLCVCVVFFFLMCFISLKMDSCNSLVSILYSGKECQIGSATDMGEFM